MEVEEKIKIQKPINPDVLGLWAFAFATFLGNVSSLGFWGDTSMMIGTALVLGGIGQVIGGWFCNQRDDLFGLVAFTSFGLFWVANGIEAVFTSLKIFSGPGLLETGWYLCLWTLFTLMLLLGSLKKTRVLTITLLFVVLLLFLKMLGVWCQSKVLIDIGSICGIISAVMAMYIAYYNFILALLGKCRLPMK